MSGFFLLVRIPRQIAGIFKINQVLLVLFLLGEAEDFAEVDCAPQVLLQDIFVLLFGALDRGGLFEHGVEVFAD